MTRRPKDKALPPSSIEEEDEFEQEEMEEGASPIQLSRMARPGPAEEGWLGGQILIAMPSMEDPRFARSVICLCAHSSEGAMGIVINRAIENLTFDELLKQLELTPVPPQRRIRLHAGGPVEGGAASCCTPGTGRARAA